MNHELAKLLGGSRWLMDPKAFRVMLDRAGAASADAIQAAVAAYGAPRTAPKMAGDVAVIECCGPILYKASWLSMYFGGSSIEEMQAQLRAALADPAVRTIAFRWDSPGGSVEMVPEFSDEIFAARGQKPIVSLSDTMVCSAAYWLASQTETIYASKSSMLGAIGVFCEHDDISGMLEKAGIKITLIAHGEHKTEGNPYEPLSEGARADTQARVDEIGDEFDAAVARGRGVTKAEVLQSFGQGRVFRGAAAIKLGLADKAGTFGQILGKLTKGRAGTMALSAPGPVAAAATSVEPEAPERCEYCEPACPCEMDACPEACATCGDGCGCGAVAKAKAQVGDADGVDDEAALIAALL